MCVGVASVLLSDACLELGVRQALAAEAAAKQALAGVSVEFLSANVIDLGIVKRVNARDHAGVIAVDIALPTAAFPSTEQLAKACHDALKDFEVLPGVVLEPRVGVRVNRPVSKGRLDKIGPGMQSIGNVIAVSSCKGGVGKSTVASNIAAALKARGGRVGLLDADVHGPSVPTLLTAEDDTVLKDEEGLLMPIMAHDIATMSFGYLGKRNKRGERTGGVMRGPMLATTLQQMVKHTAWGQLDYLVVDMPPGTGDAHITLGQEIPFAAAVMVTTPQKLSLVDVLKGIDLFEALKVPTLAVVENMSYFDCPGGSRHFPFGSGASETIVKRYGVEHVLKLPIDADINDSAETGVPIVLSDEAHPIAQHYLGLADTLIQELLRRQYKTSLSDIPTVAYDLRRNKIVLRQITASGMHEYTLEPREVRIAGQSAENYDEFTGVPLEDERSIPEDVHPTEIVEKGNYAVAIRWNDGHDSSIYPYSQLLAMAAGDNDKR